MPGRIAIFIFLFSAPTLLLAQSAERRAINYFSTLRTLQGGFTQVVEYSGGGARPKVERGNFMFRSPNEVRWEIRNRAEAVIYLYVTSDEGQWYYEPMLQQATYKKSVAGEYNVFSILISDPQGKLSFQSGGSVDGIDWVIAVPRAENKIEGVERVSVGMSGRELKSIRAYGKGGDTVTWSFTELQTNAVLPEGVFRFQPPKGVDVLNLDQAPAPMKK